MTTSVALCTYNGEKYLAEQLDSILTQTVPIDEIVVCDDGSTDNTISILEEYESTFPYLFKIYKNKENLGYTKNFEQAINLCDRDIIFLCDQDDIWLKEKVKTVLLFFIAHPKINVICHRIKIMQNGNYLQTSFWDEEGFKTSFSNHEVLQYLLFNKNVFPGMSMVLTKEAKKKFLPLKTINSTIIHDYEMAIRACTSESFALIDAILTIYRLHKDQNIGYGTGNKAENKDIYLEIKRISFVKQAVEAFGLNPSLTDGYKKFCKEKYRLFLKQLPIYKRFTTHLKYKYYYKVLNEL